jgi:polyferredoxin
MIIIGYFSIASIVFLVWFQRFWSDTSTSKKDVISWVALIFGPLFWPVVVPFSLWQINTRKPEVETAKYDGES